MRRAKTANNLSKKSNTSGVYVQSESNGLSGAKILCAIADDKSWILFNNIAIASDPTSNGQESGDGGHIIISGMKLTHSQYYQRINRLRSLGLICRKKKRGYCLSSFGRILYEIQKTIETAIQYQWKFVAIDSLVSSPSAEEMPAENRIKVINALLGDDDNFKSIFLNKNGSSGHLIKVPPL